jgi:hypothetical protein
MQEKVSTGLRGFDPVIDMLRLGDNVVWQVDDVSHYKHVVDPFVAQAKKDGRKLVYVRFGSHPPLFRDDPDTAICHLDPTAGFESFSTAIHRLVADSGRKTFYVFDCLTDLLNHWHSDLMIGNFFMIACPYLYELDTIAYFAIIRNVHTYSTIAGIRETTQLLLDLYRIEGNDYIHPLKVWQRYSPTMFFPHLIRDQEAISITASAEAAALFSSITRHQERLDYWDVLFQQARDTLKEDPERQEAAKRMLMSMMIGRESRMFELCDRYFTLQDILNIADREVGTGFIGGKSVGMLLARKILEHEGGGRFTPYLEPHDSFYLGSDVYYTYVVQNGWWKLRLEQKTPEGYFALAPELKEKLLHGKFPANLREKFVQVLEYFGQSPIIVRSSSLLEDNFGNAFAGKYESVFCANQGTPEERYEAFEQAIRIVYASTMNEDALNYRLNRGLAEQDEQMAILVQRVSGDYYGDNFFPHLAGVGNSSNLYVWDPGIDADAGMLRLVFGLGTRAVDRTVGDYARIVTLDNPERLPPIHAEDRMKYSQRYVDVISLRDRKLTTKRLEDVLHDDIKTDKSLFATVDEKAAQRLRELGYASHMAPHLLDFRRLLSRTAFPALMREMLALLSRVYEYPVDIEFTANFGSGDDHAFKVNLLQCRPLQTRGIGPSVQMPKPEDIRTCLFASTGNFMGGNVRLAFDRAVVVRTEAYMQLSEQEKYAVARLIGKINAALKGTSTLLIGPGRWGTTTPSLGVPVHFTELSHMAAICEVASGEAGFMPELSYGSHFFQDLVETGIFYAAIFEGNAGVQYEPACVLDRTNLLPSLLPQGAPYAGVIHIADVKGLALYSDVITQQVRCGFYQ